MQEHSPSSGAEQTPPKPPNNPPPQPPQIDYQLIPAEVVEGEVVVDPKASPPLTEERRIYVAYTHQQTLVNTKVSSVNYSGGLPPPEFLELAEKYHPGVTKEIFDGFSKEQDHRHSLEKEAQRADINLSYYGLAIGAILLMTTVSGSLYMFITKNIQGGTAALGISGLIILFGYFIRLTRAKREDLDKIPEPRPSQSTSATP
ncbi:MAG: DUF2335 domain-containing protein, partial [Blastocatellia bacterium]